MIGHSRLRSNLVTFVTVHMTQLCHTAALVHLHHTCCFRATRKPLYAAMRRPAETPTLEESYLPRSTFIFVVQQVRTTEVPSDRLSCASRVCTSYRLSRRCRRHWDPSRFAIMACNAVFVIVYIPYSHQVVEHVASGICMHAGSGQHSMSCTLQCNL